VTPAGPTVQVGLERLDSPQGRTLKGKRVGLIANVASVTADGRSSAEALRAGGARVVRLFAPEHGLSGKLAAGQKVSGGARVVSLYGDHTKPSKADLRGLDALVYDLQDAGVRFYTYVSTMILAQEAAAAAGVTFVVLDRPNPLGGDRVAGPVADLPKSLVNLAPGPLVHGLTAGEMARVVQRRLRGAKLVVVPMAGWRRAMTWRDTGRRWVAPSPNLRSAEAALLYPGTGLLEGTTASEGRGTAAPFRIIGAPWVRTRAILDAAASVPGIRADARTFTPRPSSAAPSPKYAGSRCNGALLTVTDDGADTFALGLALLRGLRRSPGFAFSAGFDGLVGTGRLRGAIERGASVASILASERAGIAAWRRSTRAALLYD
jgi:uncharacterized protein YbbC (DUF1343 family)